MAAGAAKALKAAQELSPIEIEMELVNQFINLRRKP
jgi:hypothetical protein